MADIQAYALSCIRLYSRLWAELERLCALPAQAPGRSQIVRLEIHLALQSCDGLRWRQLLSTPQRRAAQETLTQVLQLLSTCDTEISPHAAQAAQNLLLEAVLDHCATLNLAHVPAQIDRILALSAGASVLPY